MKPEWIPSVCNWKLKGTSRSSRRTRLGICAAPIDFTGLLIDNRSQLVAAKTGISQTDAQKRVDDTVTGAKEAETKAREAADTARKATATFAIFSALSLMIGAFVACAAAAYGGTIRDEY